MPRRFARPLTSGVGWQPLWPVLKCRSMAGFQASIEGGSSQVGLCVLRASSDAWWTDRLKRIGHPAHDGSNGRPRLRDRKRPAVVKSLTPPTSSTIRAMQTTPRASRRRLPCPPYESRWPTTPVCEISPTAGSTWLPTCSTSNFGFAPLAPALPNGHDQPLRTSHSPQPRTDP